MNTTITARLKALEQRLKNDNEVYWVDLINGFFYIEGHRYSPEQFAEWCDLHEHSIVILDDI